MWKILKFAKYLIIPILLLLYLNFIDFILASAPGFLNAEQGQGGSAGGVQVIGVGFATSVSVTRLYFGAFRLPVYVADIGDISGIHDTFFTILGIMMVAFLAWDLRFLLKEKTSYTYGSKYQWRR